MDFMVALILPLLCGYVCDDVICQSLEMILQ